MLDDVLRWLSRPAELEEDGDAMVSGLAERLVVAGLEPQRLSISFRTMHPEVWVRNVSWTPEGIRVRERQHGEQSSSDYIGSSVQAIHDGAATIRVRLEDAPQVPYPQLVELKASGATDYVIHALPIGGGARTFVSLTTNRAGGLSDAELEGLAGIVGPLALRVALASAQLATRSLLRIYLGANAARRVMEGSVRRAAGEEIHAAILFCDLRGFTTISDNRPATEVVQLLDDYFDCIAPPVQDGGGEVLKFIGDAMLAVFPTDAGDPPSACERALRVAEAGHDAFAKRQPELGAGFAVHSGRVLYGNIGARDRLDFTVIGAAVNEASRVQSLCKELHVPILATDIAVEGIRRTDLVPLGTHPLRGVREPRRIFTLRRFRPDPTP